MAICVTKCVTIQCSNDNDNTIQDHLPGKHCSLLGDAQLVIRSSSKSCTASHYRINPPANKFWSMACSRALSGGQIDQWLLGNAPDGKFFNHINKLPPHRRGHWRRKNHHMGHLGWSKPSEPNASERQYWSSVIFWRASV
jgi:hypothetical protein